jgi:hypothetical protein
MLVVEKLDLARRPFKLTFNQRLRPLKPTMSKRGADAEQPGDEPEE